MVQCYINLHLMHFYREIVLLTKLKLLKYISIFMMLFAPIALYFNYAYLLGVTTGESEVLENIFVFAYLLMALLPFAGLSLFIKTNLQIDELSNDN